MINSLGGQWPPFFGPPGMARSALTGAGLVLVWCMCGGRVNSR
jgi:hypothetical protein